MMPLLLLSPAIHSITKKKAIMEKMKYNSGRLAVAVMTTALWEFSKLNYSSGEIQPGPLSCVYL